MTPKLAKEFLYNVLDRLNITPMSMKARTVSFQDLARCNAVFVKVEFFKVAPPQDLPLVHLILRAVAKEHKFFVEFD